jgi:predicted secreted hydrolase
VVSVLVIAGLAYPLRYALDELLTRQIVHRYLVAQRYERPEIYQNVRMRRLNVDIEGGTINVDVAAISPRDLGFDPQLETEWIREYLSNKMGREVEVKTTMIRADVNEARSLPPSSLPGH